MSRLLRSK
uniref:Uncharacterized protein n=1 Tax=Zea mays TaxID=4577 RepID=C4IZL2_MAIZE|nr:unknown [Zea mays]